jgi:hypothetical protein
MIALVGNNPDEVQIISQVSDPATRPYKVTGAFPYMDNARESQQFLEKI